MKLIKPSFEIWEQPFDEMGYNKQIERVGRLCYKTEDKITDTSDTAFVYRLIKAQHYAMLEHGTIYLKVSYKNPKYNTIINKYKSNPYSRVVEKDNNAYITTNYRVIIENNWYDDVALFKCCPTEFHEKRYTVHFICDMGVGREFLRHRVMSMAQESTRYCNYSKDKFNNELTFIIPWWTNIKEGEYNLEDYESSEYYTNYTPEYSFMVHLLTAECTYKKLIEDGWKPQQARNVLPLATKSEIVLTGFKDQWQHFFDLRARGTTGIPHPQAIELAIPLMNEFKKRGIIE